MKNTSLILSLLFSLVLLSCKESELEGIEKSTGLNKLEITPEKSGYHVILNGPISQKDINQTCIAVCLGYEEIRASKAHYDHNLNDYRCTINDTTKRFFKVDDLQLSSSLFKFTKQQFNDIKTEIIPQLWRSITDTNEVYNYISSMNSLNPEQFDFADYHINDNYCDILVAINSVKCFNIRYNTIDTAITNFTLYQP